MSVPVVVVRSAEPRPLCYACGCPCIDAGSRGRLTLWPVLVAGRFRRRRVRVCDNCPDWFEE